jgi:hypothetical protein
MFNWLPSSVEPTAAELSEAKIRIANRVEQSWGGEVEIIDITVESVVGASDFPINHTWREYSYAVLMRIVVTDAEFIGIVGQELDMYELHPFDSIFTQDEIALLEAYSATTDVPAAWWYRSGVQDPDSYFPNADIWEVTPVDFNSETSPLTYWFERRLDGTFVFLEVWDLDL